MLNRRSFFKWIPALLGSVAVAPYIIAKTKPLVQASEKLHFEHKTLHEIMYVINKQHEIFTADEFYKRNGMQMPEAGDQVLIGGQLCVLKDDSEEVSSVTPLPPVANTGDDEQDLKERKTPQLPVAGRNAAMRGGIYNILKKANTEQLSELRQKLVVAEEAERTTGHVNGEWDAVVETMNKIAGGKR